jgi:hypothetical protein
MQTITNMLSEKTQRNVQASIPREGFEPAIAVFERAKTVSDK